MNIKSSKPLTVSEASEILAKRKEEGELGYEQSQAVDNSARYATEPSKVRKQMDAIVSSKITQEIATKIVDIAPNNPATLRAILVKDRVDLSEEEIAAVLKELA